MNSLKQCQAVQTTSPQYLRCAFNASPGDKYCLLHLSYANVSEYQGDLDPCINKKEENNDVPIPNPIIYVYSNKTTPCNKEKPVIENKPQVTEDFVDHDPDLKVKYLMINNDSALVEKIKKLIGPNFKNNTDDVNKYFTFSYRDSKNKIRSVTVFTLYNALQNNKLDTLIPKQDIKRAKQLIELYDKKINLFEICLDDNDDEKRIRNKVSKLFEKIRSHDFCFNESWIMNINTTHQLNRLIDETNKIINNSFFKGRNLFIFAWINENNKEKVIEMKEYIVDEWNKLIEIADGNIFAASVIIACGLSHVVPDVLIKYPTIKYVVEDL